MTNAQPIQRQLEMARMVQSALFPRSRSMSNVDVAVQCKPAGAIGGDVCDIFETDGGRTAVVLGDVCGKGIAAGLLMGLIYGAVHSSAWTASTRDHEDACERLNALLQRKTSADRFATLFWGYYEPEASTFRYINAGHVPQLLIRHDKSGNLEVHRLEKGGPVLGIVEWGNYQQGEIAVQEGDLLVMFSDGIVEAMNASGEQFGEQRLLNVIRESWGNSSVNVRDAILSDVRTHVGNHAPVADDQTLVVAELQHVFAGLDPAHIFVMEDSYAHA
jgi:phosphoserine phosphatase RsbU/P